MLFSAYSYPMGKAALASASHRGYRLGRIWVSDHFMPSAENPVNDWQEAWTTLAALSAIVPRVRLGTLVTGNTYRHPAVLAKMAATLDIISGGQLVLGLGASWQENEHRAYCIPTPLGGACAALKKPAA